MQDILKIEKLEEFLVKAANKQLPWSYFELSLRNKTIKQDDAKKIVEALKSNPPYTNTKIDLSFNFINHVGAGFLAEALIYGCFKEKLTLNMCNNRIKDAGAVSLAQALMSGFSPNNLELNLWGCEIGDAGAIAFADALKSNKCPVGLYLNLSGNQITDVGVKAIANALKSEHCPAGLKIDLLSNFYLSEASVELIADAMRYNTTAIGITINATGIIPTLGGSKETQKMLKHCFLRNQLIAENKNSPALINYIKKVSADAGYYVNRQTGVPSLKFATASFLVLNKHNAENYAEAINSLPDSKLKELIQTLDTISTKLNAQP